jgi:hypothetical protein
VTLRPGTPGGETCTFGPRHGRSYNRHLVPRTRPTLGNWRHAWVWMNYLAAILEALAKQPKYAAYRNHR